MKQKLRLGTTTSETKDSHAQWLSTACPLRPHMETDGSAAREAVSGHDTPSSVGLSARRHCKYRSFAQRPQWRREGQHRSVSHLCSPRPASHGILRTQSKVTVTGLAQCCLTPRSSGAPTAGHQGPVGGTRHIFATRALASCRRRPLSSNVRQHKGHSAVPQQKVRLSA